MSNSLWPHGLQHTRPPCPSPTPGVYPNSCPLSWWCHPTISSSVVLFSSCPQYFPASGSFKMSQLFASGGQSIGVSVSTSVLPMNTQDWSPLEWTGWISLQSKGLSRFFSKHQFFDVQFSSVQLLSCVWLFVTPWIPARQASLSITNSHFGLLSHVHWVSDAIQPSHPLSSCSPPAFNLPQHQGLFKWVSFSHQVVKVLEFQLQYQSFQWIFRTDFL